MYCQMPTKMFSQLLDNGEAEILYEVSDEDTLDNLFTLFDYSLDDDASCDCDYVEVLCDSLEGYALQRDGKWSCVSFDIEGDIEDSIARWNEENTFTNLAIYQWEALLNNHWTGEMLLKAIVKHPHKDRVGLCCYLETNNEYQEFPVTYDLSEKNEAKDFLEILLAIGIEPPENLEDFKAFSFSEPDDPPEIGLRLSVAMEVLRIRGKAGVSVVDLKILSVLDIPDAKPFDPEQVWHNV